MSDLTYAAFRADYEEQHPSSVPQKQEEVREHPSWLTWVVMAMFITSALLSGVHTAPTAYDTIEPVRVREEIRQTAALGTFVFVELGILVSSYLLFKKANWVVAFILAVCLLIAMVSNLYSVSRALQAIDIGSRIVGVALGIGAPLIATLSGKVVVNLSRSEQVATLRSRQQYQTDCKVFDSEVLAAWQKWQKVSNKLSGVQMSTLSNGQSNGQTAVPSVSTLGHRKVADSSNIVRRHLAEHPEDLQATARELAARLGVGHSTVSNVQRELRTKVITPMDSEPLEMAQEAA